MILQTFSFRTVRYGLMMNDMINYDLRKEIEAEEKVEKESNV